MAMNEWYSYQDRKQSLIDKAKPKHEFTVPKPQHSQMDVVESTPSDTYIQRLRQGILDKLK